MQSNNKIERNYKNNLFIDYIGSKENLIEVYNAVSGENYSLDADIKINTLTNVLYRSMLNDISFILDGKLIVIIEHQSTINENMPIRMLEYVAKLYGNLIDSRAFYYKKRIMIPRPEFFVFYDGEEEYVDKTALKLSHSYIGGGGGDTLELTVPIYNINLGKNKELLEKSHALFEYSTFVGKVREYKSQGDENEEAMKKAVQYCTNRGIMDLYLEEHGGDIMSILFTEYNYDDEMAVVKEEALAEGLATGREEGRSEGISIGEERGRTEGISIGEERGRAEAILANARRMKEDGVEVALIRRYTGLSEEEIAAL